MSAVDRQRGPILRYQPTEQPPPRRGPAGLTDS